MSGFQGLGLQGLPRCHIAGMWVALFGVSIKRLSGNDGLQGGGGGGVLLLKRLCGKGLSLGIGPRKRGGGILDQVQPQYEIHASRRLPCLKSLGLMQKASTQNPTPKTQNPKP